MTAETFTQKWERDRAAAYDEVEKAYDRECAAQRFGIETPEIRDRYMAAHKAVGERFAAIMREHNAEQERLEDKRIAKEHRRAVARARERQRIEQEGERKKAKALKQAERERVAARYDAARKFMEDATPPVVKISPAQAAARLNLTMEAFWARVRSGKFPPPDDDNQYHATTVDAFPRPKVRPKRARHAVPGNVYGDIWKF